jgi:hypothetical protein
MDNRAGKFSGFQNWLGEFTKIAVLALVFATAFIALCCNKTGEENIIAVEREPLITPDYTGVTVPPNIAPLNFHFKGSGNVIKIFIHSASGEMTEQKATGNTIGFSIKMWRKLLGKNKGGKIGITLFVRDNEDTIRKFNPFCIYVAEEPIDPVLCYRILYPGFESWSQMKVIQRSLEGFEEDPVVENQLLDNNCMNCHTFLKNDPGRFLIHVRGSVKGTYFVEGDRIVRKILRTDEMNANAVYPAWHPSGKFIVFSSNEIGQAFHMHSGKMIEVYDQSARLVIYNTHTGKISAVEEGDSLDYRETFPCWSPCGTWLYYVTTQQKRGNYDLRNTKFDLTKRHFDAVTGCFGKPETVFAASETGKSVTMPAISPDGRYLIFTMLDYGTFSIWHKESDLYLLDLKTSIISKMNLNSNESESHHSWSSNGRWIVFSSKRDDGLTARPFLAYFGTDGHTGKPFILPQKDPTLYVKLDKTFNRPEFVKGKIKTGPRDFYSASGKDPVRAVWDERNGGN